MADIKKLLDEHESDYHKIGDYLFEINSLVIQKPIGTQGIFVEALYSHGYPDGLPRKQWRIKMGIYFYGKDKRKCGNWGDTQFTDNYCWDSMKEAFLFAQENLIKKESKE